MFGLGIPELVIILVIVLIIFGPSQVPKIGKALGEGIRSLRTGTSEGETGDKKEPEKADEKPSESKKDKGDA